MNNVKGNVLILLLVAISLATCLTYFAFNMRANSTTRALLQQRLSLEESLLLDYVSSHLDCGKTQAQACSDPITLRKSDNSVFLSAARHTIGPIELQAACVVGDNSISLAYAKTGMWANARRTILCVTP